MEHATNISYPLFAINGTLDYETLMAHELSHHWWGNLVTCRTAGDMWINEGLASYCEALFMEGMYGTEAYKKYVRDNFKEVLTRAHRNDGGYYALADIPSALTYGDHVYKKGALIAHNLRGQLEDSTFFSIIQSLMESYSYDNISTSELKAYWQSLTQQDVTTFFEDWIEQPGLPEFRIRTTFRHSLIEFLI
jgi:aminopeptidase N